MIHVFANTRDAKPAGLVLGALRRSVTYNLAHLSSYSQLNDASIAVFINADCIMAKPIISWLRHSPRKLILFGRLPSDLRDLCGAKPVEWPESNTDWSVSPPAPQGGWSQSKAEIRYCGPSSSFGAAAWCRPLERFDFADEWNNLGYGAIRVDGSHWSLSEPVCVSDSHAMAKLYVHGKEALSYCALFDVGPSSVLWFNRPVGPIDSFEWRLIEQYLSDWRPDHLPCCPVISEIPWGYDSAVTMRLDCDEDITSSSSLWEAYKELDIPFSLAIHTALLTDDTHNNFLREFCSQGGALLSHTSTHAPNWGGSYEAATKEAFDSKERIRLVTGETVRYAVSPFHQSPPYALDALCDAGYFGCIGGIIRNDPEFILARGGELYDHPRGFIGHTQQTMLHGDCMLSSGDPMLLFKAAYDLAFETRKFFGYLDHPFSSRYSYGWENEFQRIDAHRVLIAHIRAKAFKPLFLNEIQAMDFLMARSKIQMVYNNNGFSCNYAQPSPGLNFAVEYHGRCVPLHAGTHLQ